MTYNFDPRYGTPQNAWPQAQYQQQSPNPHAPGHYGPPQAGAYPPPYPHPYGPSAPARTSRTGLWIGLVAIIGAVVLGGMVLMVGGGGGRVEVSDNLGSQAQRILDDNLSVESDGDGTKKSTNYGLSDAEIPVILTNKGDETASFTVEFDVITRTGMVLSDATASVTDLAPGQSVATTATFSTFFDVDDEVKLQITDVTMS